MYHHAKASNILITHKCQNTYIWTAQLFTIYVPNEKYSAPMVSLVSSNHFSTSNDVLSRYICQWIDIIAVLFKLCCLFNCVMQWSWMYGRVFFYLASGCVFKIQNSIITLISISHHAYDQGALWLCRIEINILSYHLFYPVHDIRIKIPVGLALVLWLVGFQNCFPRFVNSARLPRRFGTKNLVWNAISDWNNLRGKW